MASKETWDKAKHFRPESPSDKWGDADAIDDEHILRLDDFRSWLGLPIFVTAGAKTSGHAKTSWHYGRKNEDGSWLHRPCATDVIIPQYELSPFDLVLAATRFGFTGIGYYPHWRFDGRAVGGLHLDSRPLNWDADKTKNYSHNRWIGIPVDGKQQYIELSFANLIKHSGGDYGDIIRSSGLH